MGKTVTTHKLGDPSICPVLVWAEMVKCLLTVPSVTPKTTVNRIAHGQTTQLTTANNILDDICNAVTRL
eukprot:10753588-Ditylum_brightwellii.AAC.1